MLFYLMDHGWRLIEYSLSTVACWALLIILLQQWQNLNLLYEKLTLFFWLAHIIHIDI